MTGVESSAYKAARASYSERRPERFNFVRDVMAQHARDRGDARALLWTSAAGAVVEISFAAMTARAGRAAAFLADCGVRRGDVVMALLSREQAWWELFLGAMQIGAVVAPGTAQLTRKDVAYRMKATAAAVIVGNAATVEAIDGAASDAGWNGARVLVDADRTGWRRYDPSAFSPSVDYADTRADETAILYFTSGTTGRPKMTAHGFGYPLGHEATGRFWLEAGPEELVWNISDTGWAKAAWSSLFAPWICGAGIFALHADGMDPMRLLDWLERFPITTLCAPPTAYRMLVRAPLAGRRFKSLRRCLSAGEPLNPEVIDIWRREAGHEIREGYGQTETAILCGNFPGMTIKPGSMGLPAPGVDLAIIDDDGAVAPAHVEGAMAVKVKPTPPAGFFLGYRGDPERTAACFNGDWYLTGDRGYADEDGYLWFVGRADDVIISAGYRIGPFEVESALIEHPAVAESAVVSSPDETRGEVVKAFVVLASGVAPTDDLARELQEHVKKTTAPYKYPRKIEFTTTLPKTVSGKIQRNILRAREWEGRRR